MILKWLTHKKPINKKKMTVATSSNQKVICPLYFSPLSSQLRACRQTYLGVSYKKMVSHITFDEIYKSVQKWSYFKWWKVDKEGLSVLLRYKNSRSVQDLGVSELVFFNYLSLFREHKWLKQLFKKMPNSRYNHHCFDEKHESIKLSDGKNNSSSVFF